MFSISISVLQKFHDFLTVGNNNDDDNNNNNNNNYNNSNTITRITLLTNSWKQT